MDVIPDNIATLDYAFKDRTSTEKYLATCYSRLPRLGTLAEPGFIAGDDYWFHVDLNNRAQYAFDLARYGNNKTSPYFDYWAGSKGGTPLWQAIRDCNTFIENASRAGGLDDFERARWVAEVKALKAWYHFYLLRLYGPIPIIKDNMSIEVPSKETFIYREPVDKVVDYIVQLLDEAMPDLPYKIENEVSEAGRITKAAAATIKADVLVTAASPLFNGNQDYAGFKDNRGILLVNNVYDPKKWERAAVACKNAIDTCMEAGVALYRFNNPALNISDSTKLVIQPGQIIADKYNVERIWSLSSFISSDLEIYTMPRLATDHERVVYQMLVPTLKMAEMFYTRNGVPMEEDKTYDYTGRYELQTVPANHKFFMQTGYTTAKMHLDREYRFYGSLGVDGGWWYGLGRFNDQQQWPLNFMLGSVTGGRVGTERYSVTTYYVKKLSNYQSTYSAQTFVPKRFDFPIYRLANLYLLYAEALNESLPAPTAEVLQYLNYVRNRAGLKNVESSWPAFSIYPDKYTTKAGMREIIHRERSIELAFEAQRFWDLRRWKVALEYFNQPIQGWNTEGTKAQEFYQPLTYIRKQYTLKEVLWPIMQDELLKNGNLVQNPGW
ncbi:RagB/SusD family nutrient uptake outer membrane protein [Niabella drilacis]|nr:RagB/SusD family nutrient uptake outer membrane protein [Niabella drilacis]